MDSSQNSEESLSKLQITFSDDQSHTKSLDLECSMLINSESKDYSMKYNFTNLEKGLNSLSKEVDELKRKNKHLSQSLNTALKEKEDLVQSHKKNIHKLLKENKFLKESMENDKKTFKKQYEKVKTELEKTQKTLKKLAVSAESRIKELQKELEKGREGFCQELMRKDKDVEELIGRIKNIENSACQFKSSSSSNLNQYHSANGFNKSNSVLIRNKSLYSIDQLSEIIVNLEKNQAQLKEKIYNESQTDRKSINSELAVNEMKLSEIRELQKRALRDKQNFKYSRE